MLCVAAELPPVKKLMDLKHAKDVTTPATSIAPIPFNRGINPLQSISLLASLSFCLCNFLSCCCITQIGSLPILLQGEINLLRTDIEALGSELQTASTQRVSAEGGSYKALTAERNSCQTQVYSTCSAANCELHY